MNVILYMECENDEMSFDNSAESFYNDKDYIKALEDNYNRTKDVIYENINNGFSSCLNGTKYIFDTTTRKDKETSLNELKTSYTSCNAILYQEDLKAIDKSVLNRYITSNDVFIIIIDLDFNTSEEDFEIEFKLWLREHFNINSLNQDEDWKFLNEPQRNLMIKTEMDNERYILNNCKIIEKMKDNSYAILVEKINFIK